MRISLFKAVELYTHDVFNPSVCLLKMFSPSDLIGIVVMSLIRIHIDCWPTFRLIGSLFGASLLHAGCHVTGRC